ncbi:hypothetical protein ASG25_20775 [Rhizobium sp. Leaf384]|nr:hypothetical protein ASG25_20775 [Rhizobium sp. Leaf384]
MRGTRYRLPQRRDQRADLLDLGDIRGSGGRFATENLPSTLALVEPMTTWPDRCQARPCQIALAWLPFQKPFIVPIQGPHKFPT